MNFFRNAWHLGASALITVSIYSLPLGFALVPDFSPDLEFVPVAGNGSPRASFVVVDMRPEPSVEDTAENQNEDTESETETDVQDIVLTEAETFHRPRPISSLATSTENVSTPPVVAETETTPVNRPAIRERPQERPAEDMESHDGTADADDEGEGEGRARRSRRNHCEPTDDRIRRNSRNSYSIDDEVVREYTESISAASRLASVGWHEDDVGEIDGFQLFRVRCGSPLHQAGLRSRDIIHSIDGRQIRTYAQGLVAWRVLRNRSNVEVVFTRRGERRTMSYDVT